MSNYYREQGFTSRNRFLRRLKYIWAVLVVGVVLGGGFFAYDVYRQAKNTNQASSESKAVTSVVVSNTQLQSSPYFQFQSPRNWKVIASESLSNHFVYRQYNGTLIEQELVIDIDNTVPEVLALVQTTHVLPVTITNAGKISLDGFVSPACKEIIKPLVSNNPVNTTYKKVKFNCNPQTNNFIAVVGLEGGTNAMQLPRPDGTKATYNITYRNLTAQPTSGDFEAIMRTFETR